MKRNLACLLLSLALTTAYGFGQTVKYASTNSGCTTNGENYYCTIQITWSGTAFSDTNYGVVCTPKSVSAAYGTVVDIPGDGTQELDDGAFSLVIPDANKTTTTTTVKVVSLSNMGTNITVTGLSCIAVHN